MGIDVAGYVVCVYIVAIGTENRVSLNPIDILDIAITKKAKRIILAHNHPGQDMENVYPSKSDIDFILPVHRRANRILHASKPFGFQILDHLILCDDGYFSFLSESLIDAIEDMKDYKPYKDVEPEIIKERKDYGVDKLIEGIDKGLAEGKRERNIEIVKSMLADNMDIDIIMKHTKLTEKEILKIKSDMGL